MIREIPATKPAKRSTGNTDPRIVPCPWWVFKNICSTCSLSSLVKTVPKSIEKGERAMVHVYEADIVRLVLTKADGK